MTVIDMNGASYIDLNPTSLVLVEQTDALVSLECLDAILPIETILQEPPINDLSSLKSSSEDVLKAEAPIE
jgi:hypothetical protein